MEVVFLTGSHPRHLHVAKCLLEAGFLKGLLIEKRPNLIPNPPAGLNEIDRNNFIRHFADRAEAEAGTFGEISEDFFEKVNKINVTKEELNSNRVKEWVKAQTPDVVISYGVHMLSDELLDEFPEYSWNIHGGLSPWYRGCITLFWPFYFLQPNWAGMTIHYLTSKLDAGHIIHHSVPELKYGDGIHDVATRAVVQVGEDIVKILKKLELGVELPKERQKSSGKLFLARDWKPQHLRLIYNTFDNDIVDQYLDGNLSKLEPQLIRAF
ncbi:methionyl-tRNA formyltransferase [Orenia metallireducens]|uniref:phosphoribosylglycinamide formyltransferase 1 n=1 Tax=Orenia metallireducens TaxID=1413210 RepID=A0A1C0AB54_9FIRM|nr:formyltransferase family protein [Orenia metallireducens]OCL27609.1 methionyl-tRNA formyltransferase [Orenia metallireducens]